MAHFLDIQCEIRLYYYDEQNCSAMRRGRNVVEYGKWEMENR